MRHCSGGEADGRPPYTSPLIQSDRGPLTLYSGFRSHPSALGTEQEVKAAERWSSLCRERRRATTHCYPGRNRDYQGAHARQSEVLGGHACVTRRFLHASQTHRHRPSRRWRPVQCLARDPRDFDRQRRLIDATRSGDFEPSIEGEIKKYREDKSPATRNVAPVEYWPSTGAFRTVFYLYGLLSGREALGT